MKLGSATINTLKLGASQVSKAYIGATEVWAGTGSAAYRAAVLADSPVAYWRLGESSGTTAADEVGSYPGTYVGSPTLGASGIFAGNSAITTAAGKYATAGFVRNPASGNLTVECWIKTTATASAQVAIQQGDGSGTGRAWIYHEASPAAISSFLGGSALSSGVNVNGTWQHVVVTISGTNHSIYVNGTLAASRTASMETCVGSMFIGVNKTLLLPWAGSLDEVAIYNTALSSTRIAAHYAAAGY